jgi:predicted transposase/invertase (TIGR01784 family)
MTKKRTHSSHITVTQSSVSLLDTLEEKCGPLGFKLTNDYLFRAVFQENEEARKGLLSALLHIPKEEILTAFLLNPIILGDNINEKEIILDLKIFLNNSKILNLEMQVSNEGDWPERSLFYLSEAFSKLPKGESYRDVKTSIHIGILDFNLFPDNQGFYSEYLLSDTHTHKIYSDKFSIRVLNLKQIHHATPEDHQFGLCRWAKFFTATTWEEIKMLAQEDNAILEAALTVQRLLEDEKVHQQYLARQLYEHDQISLRKNAIQKGLEQGKREGLEQGLERGLEQGIDKISHLNQKLIADNRMDDLVRAASDRAYLEQLLEEYNL